MAIQTTTLELKRRGQRELATYTLGLVLVILAAVSAKALWQYLMPQPVLMAVGRSDALAAREEPHHLTSANPRADLFVVQVHGEWLALDAQTPHTTRCKVRWISANQRFEDPCSGSKFAINGGYLEGPAWSHLARYPVLIEQNALSVDLARQLEDTSVAFVERCLLAQRQRAARLTVDSQTETQPCRHGVCFDLRESVPDFAITDFCQDLWQNHQRQRPYFRMFDP